MPSPLPLQPSPFFALLLQAREHNRHGHTRVFLQSSVYLLARIAPVHSLDNLLIYRRAPAAKVGTQLQVGSLFRAHLLDARLKGVQHSNRTRDGVNVNLILVTLLLAPVQESSNEFFLCAMKLDFLDAHVGCEIHSSLSTFHASQSRSEHASFVSWKRVSSFQSIV